MSALGPDSMVAVIVDQHRRRRRHRRRRSVRTFSAARSVTVLFSTAHSVAMLPYLVNKAIPPVQASFGEFLYILMWDVAMRE